MKRGFIFILLLTFFAQLNAQSTANYEIKFLEINKSNSDYGVAFVDHDKLIFTSADDDPAKARKNFNPRKDLYVGNIDFDGEIGNAKLVTNKVNKKFNQTGMAYTKDKKTVYFSRNKYKKKKKKQNKPKFKKRTLYKADVAADGSWTNIKKLPFNKKKHSISYPVLSADDTKLYFVSDMQPSLGKTDIFVVDILGNGDFSEPRNLGSAVNTPDEETTPYVTADNIMYFSSNGREGLGKLDVYAVELFQEHISETYHLASPINSLNDDFAYIVNEDNNQGYFSSNRLQGEGFDDLYAFTLEEDVRPGECFITVDGRVRDRETLELLSGATLDLLNLDGELLESVSSFEDGTYKFTVSCANEYIIKASNPNYRTDQKRIEILEENYHSALHTNINLTRIKEDVSKLALQPIYYEFDRSTITEDAKRKMDAIVEIMKDNTDLIIEASSFADSRGTNAYNQKLSERRSQAAIEYLKAMGIEAERIKSSSYGEERLLNQCINGVDCEEEAHQMNRRTEFHFVNKKAPAKKTSKRETKVELPTKKTEYKAVPEAKEEVARKESKKIQTQKQDLSLTQTNTTAQIDTNLGDLEIEKPEGQDKEIAARPKYEEAEALVLAKKNTVQLDHSGQADISALKTENFQEPTLAEVAEAPAEPVEAEPKVQEVAETPAEPVEVEPKAQEVAETPAEPVEAEPKVQEVAKVTAEPVEEEVVEAPAKLSASLGMAASMKQQKSAQPTSRYTAAKKESSNDMISEEREELAAIQREKASYKVEQEEASPAQSQAKEEVIVNYNSSIVATNPESNKVLNYIVSEKEKMIEKLSALKAQYDASISEYPAVADSLEVESQRIAAIIEKAENLEETGWSNIIEYKNNALNYKKRFRELVVMNNRGRTPSRDQGPGEIRIQEEEAVASAAPLSNEKLGIDKIQITAMKKNGNGKYQETNNANKTDLIKVTFKIKSNQKVVSGRKQAHLVVENPEGNVTEAKGIFTISDSNSQSKYTDHAIINYNNHDVDVTMFVQRKGAHFEKGVYPVKVFLEGKLLAQTKLKLDNTL